MLTRPAYASLHSMPSTCLDPARHAVTNDAIEETEARLSSRINSVYKSYDDSISKGRTSTPLMPVLETREEIREFFPSRKGPADYKERNKVVFGAEECCADAIEFVINAEKGKAFDHINLHFGKFIKCIETATTDERPYSLLWHKGMTCSELDFFNVIRFAESPEDRSSLWIRMSNIYEVHVHGPQSELEEKQLAGLFFNSVYVKPELAGDRFEALGRHITAAPKKNNTFVQVLAHLAHITDPEDQADAAHILTERIGFVPFIERRGAIQSFMAFLPGSMTHHDALATRDRLQVIFADYTEKEKALMATLYDGRSR